VTTVEHSSPSAEVRALLSELPAAADEPTVEAIRAAFSEFVRTVDERGVVPEVEAIVDGDAAGVPVRTYEPLVRGEMLATLVYLHGGGWAAGDLDTADAGARHLCAGLETRVVSVDYRLAPEHPFPAGLDDALSVLEAVAGAATGPVAIGGESAGGNLAAAAALAWRDLGGRPLAVQILINPLLDAACAGESHRALGTGYGLTTADCRRYVEWYAPDGCATPGVSPLAAEPLERVAPAVVATAGFDPLLDDGARYAQRLIGAGVPVAYVPMPRMMHGWWSLLPASPDARAEAERLVQAVKGMLAS
jgi:acetyl esterase